MQNNADTQTVGPNPSLKIHNSSIKTSHSSHHTFPPQTPTMTKFKKAQSQNLEWQKIQDQIMLWFATKNIRLGKPEDIFLEPAEVKKRQICGSNNKTEPKGPSLLGRRLGRSLTICL